MDMKRHLKSALKQIGFDKPRKAQIIPMNTLDAEQDAIIIAATGSGKQVIYETVGLAHSDKLTIVIEPLLALIYNQVQNDRPCRSKSIRMTGPDLLGSWTKSESRFL